MNKQDKIIYIREYLEFKAECIRQDIFDIDEIIKLFEVGMRVKWFVLRMISINTMEVKKWIYKKQ